MKQTISISQAAKLATSTTQSALLLSQSVDGCEKVQAALEQAGIRVDRLRLGPAALVEALGASPSAVFLDARLDLGAAARLCSSLRAVEGLSAVHVVALTESSDSEARLRLYEAGVDDCWTFVEDARYLERRARELARPMQAPEPPRVLRCGGVTLDPERYTVTCWGSTAQLTAMQLKLLAFLMRRPGVIFSYRQLLDDVWSNPDGDERMVRAGIVRLRRVLGRGAVLIRTVRGGGYAFEEGTLTGGEPDAHAAPFTKP